MRSDSFRRLAAAAGLASATAVAGAQIPAEVTVPLGDSYSSGYSTNGVVYDSHGGQYEAYAGPGYVPPARYPVDRIPVQYLRYYPSAWYGLPGSTLPVVAPQVYMPTDTTQLGYYYQRVPTWVPVPGMIPGPPNPALIHSYGAGVTGGTITDGSMGYGNTVPGEQVISTQPVSTGGPIGNTPKSSKAGAHTPAGTTGGDTGVAPVPPGGSRLPLQPPPTAPPAEPSAFLPPPAPTPLLPVSAEDAI